MIALTAAAAHAQTPKTGPQVAAFTSGIDDSSQQYALYVPRGFDGAKKYPLVISLHDAGSNHRLNLRRVFGRGNMAGENDADATRYFPSLPDVDFIVAAPLARGTMGYQGIPEQDVYDVLADVERRFPIDEDRVYLTGISMGGGGALWLGLTRPDVWAAIAAVCPTPPEGTIDLAPNALDLPLRFLHGREDPVVNPEISREFVAKLNALGSKVEYDEYPGVKHNSWDRAYRNGAIFPWFAQFQRNRFPDRVRFVSRQYRYREAYWARFDELTPGDPASIDAQFTGPNQIQVTASGLGGFTLSLAGHPRYAPRRPLRVVINGKAITVRAGAAASFHLQAGVWRTGERVAAANSKRAGAEGPIGEALSSRHIYVYGTAGSPTPDELNSRRAEATRAAHWSSPRAALQLSFRVIPDRDVKPEDLDRANLILFGTKETNSLIAQLAPRLPIELNAGAADYGLVYVFPSGKRYVLINSGLPWWTGAEYSHRITRRYMPPPYAVALTFPDFVVFQGSLDRVIVEGRFDNNWRLKPADAAKMTATGAIKVNP